MSDEIGGGQPIADTGDYSELVCPRCGEWDLQETDHLNPRPLAPKATVRHWDGCLMSWGLWKRRSAIEWRAARSMERYYRSIDRKDRKAEAKRRAALIQKYGEALEGGK